MAEPIDFDPINNPIHALRLEYGDVDEYDYILSDQSYQYYMQMYPDSPRMVSKSVGMAILAKFAREGYRQRVGQEEAYLGERYKNYLDWIKQKIVNPSLSGRLPMVYVGGVFLDYVEFYDNHPNMVDSQFFRGQQTDTKTYLRDKDNIRIGRRRGIIK